jgi:hypothetical protein
MLDEPHHSLLSPPLKAILGGRQQRVIARLLGVAAGAAQVRWPERRLFGWVSRIDACRHNHIGGAHK